MLHGGEIYNTAGIDYDFSVNINPLGIPEGVVRRLGETISDLTRYPDQSCRDLRLALEGYTGVPAGQILCGNGASELLGAVMRGLEIGSVLLAVPSFSGYEYAAKAAGLKVHYHMLKREEGFALTERYLEDLAKAPDLAILCSPANPVGNRIDQKLLLKIAEICERQNTWLLMDECFIGFVPDEDQTSMRRHILKPSAFRKLLVLDAFTKRFAIPGLRLGYLMAADGDALDRIHGQQPEWSVSYPAQIAGAAALWEAEEYMGKARRMIASERGVMTAAMEAMGFTVFLGEANYIFFSSEAELYEPLLKRGLLIRSCDNYRGLRRGDYRVAIRQPEDNRRLIKAMKEVVNHQAAGGQQAPH